MKKILSIIFAFVLCFGTVGVAEAQMSAVGGQTLWKMISGALQPVVPSWDLGSVTNRISKIWSSSADIEGTATTTRLCFSSGECMSSPNVFGSNIPLFLHNQASADIPAYEMLRTYPPTGSEIDESCTADADVAGGYCTLDTYVSTTTDLSITGIPAGVWEFEGFNYVNNVGGNSKMETNVYRRTSLGVETFMFQATSSDINTTSVVIQNYTSAQPAFAFDPTDRIVFVKKAWTDQSAAKVIHQVYGASNRYSRAKTPINILSFDIGGGGSNPWTESYDAGTFDLFNVGKIGIGTSTPGSYLTIADVGGYGDQRGGIQFTTDGTQPLTDMFLYFDGNKIVIDVAADSNNESGGFQVNTADFGEAFSVTSNGAVNIGAGTDQVISVLDDMYFNGGYIGIGTSTPASALFLYGDGATTGGISFGNGSNGFWHSLWDDGSALNLNLIDAAELKIWNDKDGVNEVQIANLNSDHTLEIYSTTTSSGLAIFSGYGLKFGDNTIQKTAPRWKDGASVVNATTTDEAYKIGNCLEPGVSVTLDNVVSIIASTTNTIPQSGMTWNINIGTNFYEVADTLFDSDITTTSTSTQTENTPDVTAIPAGYCWWFKPVSAQTSQIGVFNFNLYGYED